MRFIVTLEVGPDPLTKTAEVKPPRPPEYRLRRALKRFLRSFGFKAASARPETPAETPPLAPVYRDC